jgi:chaperone modulatory protein CbpM
MKSGPIDAQWLHAQAKVSLEELEASSGIPSELLRELVDYGALSPTNEESAEWTFSADCIVTLRRVGRLQQDFELAPDALAFALGLVERIQALETKLRNLETQLPQWQGKSRE